MKNQFHEDLFIMQKEVGCQACFYWDEDTKLGYPGCTYPGSIEIAKTDLDFPVSCNRFRGY